MVTTTRIDMELHQFLALVEEKRLEPDLEFLFKEILYELDNINRHLDRVLYGED